MKNILNKIYIHPLTYFFIISGLITGYFNMVIAIIIIIFFHELGHVVASFSFGYNITKIEFYPFGGMTLLDKDINSPTKEELILSISGILMQVVLGLMIYFFCNLGLIRLEFYQIFKIYNMTILLFNLIPIIPLDGHIFLKTLFEIVLPFRKSFVISTIISVILLTGFIYFNIVYNINNYIILSFLIYKLWDYVKKYKFIETRFYLERYLHNYNYPKIKIISGINLKKMYKEKTHYFVLGSKYYKEDEILFKKFDKTP